MKMLIKIIIVTFLVVVILGLLFTMLQAWISVKRRDRKYKAWLRRNDVN